MDYSASNIFDFLNQLTVIYKTINRILRSIRLLFVTQLSKVCTRKSTLLFYYVLPSMHTVKLLLVVL